MAVTESFAVGLAGEPEGWVVEASSADEAIDIVHGTVPRAREAGRKELLVWTERYYRDRCLPGAEMPTIWLRLGPRPPGTKPGSNGTVSGPGTGRDGDR